MRSLHKDNIHNSAYDFKFLVQANPELSKFLNEQYERLIFDFSNPKAVKELNRTLLKVYYKINFWEFPDKNLCPPIPGRVDYLHYLSDLVSKENIVEVLDIGTGASCIYPLLGASLFDWKFVATDIDKGSLKFAQENITKNYFSDKIELRHQQDKTHILEGVVRSGDSFTFTMCNPPFYKSIEEANLVNKRKTQNLGLEHQRNFSGSLNELCYEGGEKAFLHTYLYESSKYPKVSKWFTSLVSNKDNIKSLKTSAKKLGASEFKEIQMHQGNKITRIACWRF